jgi:anaerobic selenocysteine-containing dehydrogenase
VRAAVVRANPADLDRIGAADGDAVLLRSARGSRTLPCQVDAQLPRGVVAVDFNLAAGPGAADGGVPSAAGGENTAAALIEVGAAVTEVRLESVR